MCPVLVIFNYGTTIGYTHSASFLDPELQAPMAAALRCVGCSGLSYVAVETFSKAAFSEA